MPRRPVGAHLDAALTDREATIAGMPQIASTEAAALVSYMEFDVS